jgi:hypothetical protein
VAAAALFAGRWVICTNWRGEAPNYLSFSSSAMQVASDGHGGIKTRPKLAQWCYWLGAE